MGKILSIATILIIMSTALLQSCNATGCTDNQNSLPLAGFYSADTEASITIDSLEIGGVVAPDDSLLYKSGTALTEIYLPLRATASQTAYYFRYTQEAIDYDDLNDTITFDYSSQPYFASEECGAMYHYRITSLHYTRHIIDSIGISPDDSLITNENLQRIKIFFRTETPE